jgi:hypothetical protein
VHLAGVEEMKEPYCWYFCGTTFYDKKECFGWWEEMQKTNEMLSNQPPIALYTEPQTKEWQYLTDDEIKEIVGSYANGLGPYVRDLFNKIEAKIREKNEKS